MKASRSSFLRVALVLGVPNYAYTFSSLRPTESLSTRGYASFQQRRRRSQRHDYSRAQEQHHHQDDSSNHNNGNLASRQNISDPQQEIQVLSQDPLVYLIPNLLSPQECLALQDYVNGLPPETRPMTRSNPPEVSLELAKLWPLPWLSLLAAIPPVYRLITTSASSMTTTTITLNDIILAGLPNVVIALTASAVLAFGVVLPLVRQLSASSSRTSDAIALNQIDDIITTNGGGGGGGSGADNVVQALVNRVCAATQHSWDKWEAPVVTRYKTGAVFARHGDASPTRGSEWQNGLGGQRVVTCICYLNTLNDEEDAGGGGGETYFDVLDLAVPPIAGTALIFFPADSETWVADDRTTHESLPVPEGKEKWIVQMFGRAQRVPHPLGLPDAFQTLVAQSTTTSRMEESSSSLSSS